MEKQKPIKKFFIGNVTASIWKNEGKNGPVFSITTTRRYKKDEQWNDTASLVQKQSTCLGIRFTSSPAGGRGRR